MSPTLTNVFFFSFTIFYAMGTSVPYNLFQEKQQTYAVITNISHSGSKSCAIFSIMFTFRLLDPVCLLKPEV